MPLAIRPLHPRFVAEVTGVDMRVPPDTATRLAITEAADTYAVLVFPGQFITDEQHVAFSLPFGRLETTIKAYRPGFKGRLDPRVADISNLDENSALLSPTDRRRMNSLGNRLWHTDYTFKETPGLYSLLSARVVPNDGGETQFADMRAAYDALPERMKRRVDGLVAEHSLLYSRGTLGFVDFTDEEKTRLGSAPQPIVRVHPGSGRRTLVSRLARHDDPRHGSAEGSDSVEGTDGPRDQARIRAHAPLERGRPRAVGQSLHHAPGVRIRPHQNT